MSTIDMHRESTCPTCRGSGISLDLADDEKDLHDGSEDYKECFCDGLHEELQHEQDFLTAALI